VFDRYHIVDQSDIMAAVERVVSAAQTAQKNLIQVSENALTVREGRRPQKSLTA
jgi:hypothetical protein